MTPKNQRLRGLLAYLIALQSTIGFGQLMDKQDNEGLSTTPIVAANSTYGFMGGGAAIYYYRGDSYHKFLVLGVLAAKGQHYLLTTWDSSNKWFEYGVKLQSTNYFQAYYGDTYDVRKEEPSRIPQHYRKARPYLAKRLSPNLSLQGFWDYRHRIDDNKLITPDDETQHIEIYPDDQTWTLGFAAIWDEREAHDISPHKGYYHTEWRYMPGDMATNADDPEPFIRGEIDLRYIWQLEETWFFAQRLWFGASAGDPTFNHQFVLGGEPALRGYGYSRFLGDQFVATQSEFRYHIWGIISGNTFVDVANIGFDKFEGPFYSYGQGFKFSLPPDYVAKLRLDIGFSPEGNNFTMQADHVF